jgi:hypothetical protein
MTMVYLANVPCIEGRNGMMFYTNHEHVAVDYPTANVPHYAVWSLTHHLDMMVTKDFATAMDTAAEWLKRAEQA